jgi:DNA-binding NarL/FixJ family response regulator
VFETKEVEKIDNGECVATSANRILVVDDYEPFRRFLLSKLASGPGLQVIAEVSDGLLAVQKTEEFQPDLILLDIGLPTLNGIEAARRIRTLSPKTKIIFVSQESSVDIVQETFNAGASGYVVKADAASELLAAVDAVLRGEQFVGGRFAGHSFRTARNIRLDKDLRDDEFVLPPRQGVKSAQGHEVVFYTDDKSLIDHVTQLIGGVLRAGNSALVIATKSHQDSFLARLQAYGLDMAAAIERGRYVALDAADALSAIMRNDMPDAVQFRTLLGDCILRAADATQGSSGRVAIFGECVRMLWEQDNAEAAIAFERLGNEQILPRYNVDILCGYSLGSFQDDVGSHVFRRICAEHSAVHYH